jgi:Plavaka transposase
MQLSDDDSELDNISSPLPPDPPVIQDSDEEPTPTASSQKRRYENIEEDELPEADSVYIQEFPANFHAGCTKGEVKTQFEILREKQRAEGREPWFPFPSEDEWELAHWLMESTASQSKIDSFLKLKAVHVLLVMIITLDSSIIPKVRGVAPAYKNARGFLKFIDALPPGPKFSYTPLKVVGDMKDANGNNRIETLELWHRDPVECIAELLGNPSFRGKQQYAPRRVFRNKNGTNQEFGEMWTADWWWKIQVREHNIQRMLRKAYFGGRNYYLLVRLLSPSSSHQTRPSSQHSVGTNRLGLYTLPLGTSKRAHVGNHPLMPLFFSVTSRFRSSNASQRSVAQSKGIRSSMTA